MSAETDLPIQSFVKIQTLNDMITQFDLLFKNNTDIIFSIDLEGRILNINPAGEKILGYTKEELISLSYEALIISEQRDWIRQLFQESLNHNTPDPEQQEGVVITVRNKEGQRVELRIMTTVPVIAGNELRGITGIARNITHQTYTERQLKNSEYRYQSLFEHNPDPVFSVDLKGYLTSVNPMMEKLTGYSREELLHTPMASLLVPDELQRTMVQFEKAKEGETQRYNTALYSKKKEKIMVRITNVPIYENEQVAGVFGIMKDITEKSRYDFLLEGHNYIHEMIARVRPLKEILEAIVCLVEGLSPGGIAAVYLLSDDKKNLLHGVSPRLPVEFTQHFHGALVESIKGSCGIAIRNKKRVIVPHIDTDPNWSEYLGLTNQYGLKACWSTPILDNQGEVLGTFCIYYRIPRSPDAYESTLLDRAIHLAKLAILHHKTKEHNHFLALHDPLTGLPNRRLFQERFEHAIKQAHKGNYTLSVLFIDLDRFKFINDTMGHYIGDRLLQQVAQILKACVGESNTVCRHGGDEFLILLEQTTPLETEYIAENIKQALSKPFNHKGHEIVITPSIGISLYPSHARDIQALILKADQAMYQAKRQGKNNFQVFQPHMDTMATILNEKLEIEAYLRRALEKQEFILHYQPQIDLKTNRIQGVEALIRWSHPLLGMVPPSKFIPLAEETGLIVPIGEWVIRTACFQAKRWADGGFPPLIMSVNLSVSQFNQRNLVASVKKILKETGVSPSYLEFEITESMTMNVETAMATLEDLKSLGVKIAIDDFGTGYSSLNYLKRLPIDRLKIDQSFVRDITTDSNDRDIVATIIAMGHTLKKTIVAEGVETKEQYAFLQQHHCDMSQGYLLGRPLSAEQFFETFGDMIQRNLSIKI
ncbi:EAL domain-containing protein [Ammoniphilus sp. YIM 78166]|uniref:bifunctional diguanylate cyclase/phosphodiesterase n=1 Tax=Ammoniphilus sp. YIM 78166 TaxID=1644106 RepID=UPI0010705BC0|nr:EAL domain-containing protein [Ammoniphilus sp. YIM 78166]